MKYLLRILPVLLLLFATGCEYEEVKRPTGYKGKARLNPWLAVERFCGQLGYEVESLPSWKNPEWTDAVCFVPAELLNSRGFIERMDEWVVEGGHLVILCDYSQAEWNDWSEYNNPVTRIEEPLEEFLEESGIKLITSMVGRPENEILSFNQKFGKQVYKIEGGSLTRVKIGDEKPNDIFISKKKGEGRISVVTDARMFRNRGIDQKEHASFLIALINADDREGVVNFIRGSGISLMDMIGRHLWPLLIGLGVMLVFWLWKSMARFGPLEAAAAPSPLRGYDHHLEALGDFQWRLDKCTSLLAPLRERIVEMGQHLAMRSGRRDSDFFEFLSERSGVPRERVVRALSEAAPADSAVLTRTAGDLQLLIQSLNRNS